MPAIRAHREEKGQAAIELLLMIPMFMLLVLLVLDFGIMMYQWVGVQNAVREGVRYGAVNCESDSATCTADLVKARTSDRSGGFLASGDVTVAWADRSSPSDDNRGRGDSVLVSASKDYDFLFFPGVNINVHACADMRLEQNDGAVSLPAGISSC